MCSEGFRFVLWVGVRHHALLLQAQGGPHEGQGDPRTMAPLQLHGSPSRRRAQQPGRADTDANRKHRHALCPPPVWPHLGLL